MGLIAPPFTSSPRAKSRLMYRNFLSVGGLTSLSRLTGFIRDLVLSALIGAGPIADAFFVALKLPNQFRSIFGEGAFNAAYIPTYTKVLAIHGMQGANRFSSQIFTLLLLSQLALVGFALIFTPQLVELTAPGFNSDPERFHLAITMTRITFPYLAFVTLATLHTGTLNAHGRFAVGAFAPVLLNVFIVGFLALSFRFPNAGVAASWGVCVSGAAQLALLAISSRRHGLLERLARPTLDSDIRFFFKALGPAILGSAGQQILILMDTILASLLPIGAVSSLYYAERLYQLPQGIISLAAATVLLPEMSRRLAKTDSAGASLAQNKTVSLTLLLTGPFFVLFLELPESVIQGAFVRGAFDGAAALAAAKVLAAYGLALFPIVLIRLFAASFQARGDTKTPAIAFLAGLILNLTLKLAIYQSQGAAGLALATAAGAWINLLLLIYIGQRRGWTRIDSTLIENVAIMCLSCGALALALPTLAIFVDAQTASLHWLHKEVAICLAVTGGFALYALVALATARAFGRSPKDQLF